MSRINKTGGIQSPVCAVFWVTSVVTLTISVQRGNNEVKVISSYRPVYHCHEQSFGRVIHNVHYLMLRVWHVSVLHKKHYYGQVRM